MNVNDRFMKFLEKEKISQSEIAEVFGVSRQTVSGIKRGKSILTTGQIVIIAEKYKKLNLRWLLTGEGQMIKGYAGNDNIDFVNDYETRCKNCEEKERNIQTLSRLVSSLEKQINLLEGNRQKTGSD